VFIAQTHFVLTRDIPHRDKVGVREDLRVAHPFQVVATQQAIGWPQRIRDWLLFCHAAQCSQSAAYRQASSVASSVFAEATPDTPATKAQGAHCDTATTTSPVTVALASRPLLFGDATRHGRDARATRINSRHDWLNRSQRSKQRLRYLCLLACRLRSYLLFKCRFCRYATYVCEVVVPPRPVQFVWKTWPRGLSTRSYVWAPK